MAVNGQRSNNVSKCQSVIENVSKWSKSVSICKSVSKSDSIYMIVSGKTHLRPTPVISKIVWLCNQKLLNSLYYVLIYAVDMLI